MSLYGNYVVNMHALEHLQPAGWPCLPQQLNCASFLVFCLAWCQCHNRSPSVAHQVSTLSSFAGVLLLCMVHQV